MARRVPSPDRKTWRGFESTMQRQADLATVAATALATRSGMILAFEMGGAAMTFVDPNPEVVKAIENPTAKLPIRRPRAGAPVLLEGSSGDAKPLRRFIRPKQARRKVSGRLAHDEPPASLRHHKARSALGWGGRKDTTAGRRRERSRSAATEWQRDQGRFNRPPDLLTSANKPAILREDPCAISAHAAY